MHCQSLCPVMQNLVSRDEWCIPKQKHAVTQVTFTLPDAFSFLTDSWNVNKEAGKVADVIDQ